MPQNQLKAAMSSFRRHLSSAGGRNFCVRQAEALEPRRLFSTYTVNTLLDTPSPGLLTLRQAVVDANLHAGADTINFSPSLFLGSVLHTLTLVNGEITLTDTTGLTTVAGPGASLLDISGNDASRVFDIAASASVSVSGATVSNGLASLGPDLNYEGGGIYNAGNLTLSHVVVSNNYATGDSVTDTGFMASKGGGIYSTGQLTIQNSIVSGNHANGASRVERNPSGSYEGEAAAGGGICSTGPLSISASVISSNTAIAGSGGTTGFHGVGGDAHGGGVYSSGNLTLAGSTLTGNQAVGGNTNSNYSSNVGFAGIGSGGAVYCTFATITSSNLSGNAAEGGQGGFYGDVGGSGAGGAVYSLYTLTLTTSVISGNQCTSGLSLAASSEFAQGGGMFAFGMLNVVQSTVSGNTATGGTGDYDGIPGGRAEGGGIWVNAVFTLTKSSITGNTSVGGKGSIGNSGPPIHTGVGGDATGGGIYAAGTIHLTDSTLANNHATGGHGGDTTGGAPNGGANGGNGIGGGIYDSATSLQLNDTTVSGNASAGGTGGAGYYFPAYLSRPAGSPGTASGGGLAIITGSTLLDNSILSANHAGKAFNDISGAASASSSNNLIGIGGGLINGVHANKVGVTNPLLSPLGNFGGPTQTMVPLAGSPAIDAGSNALIPAGITSDQRGLPRIFNKIVDIGAVEFSAVQITGSVFNDINGDGIRQATDPGLAGWQVYVDVGNHGVYTAGDPIATTNSAGNYVLPVTLTPGSTPLIIREIRQTGWRRTLPAGIYPLGFYSLTPTTATVGNITFGNSRTALVQGAVFHDINANGKQDVGDASLAAWTIEVDYLTGGVWQNNKFSTVTDAKGNYSLILAAGMYRIHDVLKSGLRPTIPVGGNYTLTLSQGATVTGENFGNQ